LDSPDEQERNDKKHSNSQGRVTGLTEGKRKNVAREEGDEAGVMASPRWKARRSFEDGIGDQSSDISAANSRG
jgi:hypothetical protein